MIQVNTSNRGIAAALLQKRKPIAFASKSQRETKQRYDNIELIAVGFGCERFRTYIYGFDYQIESDHKPLEMINLKKLIGAAPRFQRIL